MKKLRASSCCQETSSFAHKAEPYERSVNFKEDYSFRVPSKTPLASVSFSCEFREHQLSGEVGESVRFYLCQTIPPLTVPTILELNF